MSNRFFRSAAALFMAIMLPISFGSCKKEEPVEDMSFDWSDYVIITPPGGVPSSDSGFGKTRNLLGELKDKIAGQTGKEPESDSDSSPLREHEIIIGGTGREEAAALKDTLKVLDYAVVYKNGSFVIAGGDAEALANALTAFINRIPRIEKDLSEGYLIDHRAQYVFSGEILINGYPAHKFRLATSDPKSGKHIYHITSRTFELEYPARYGYRLNVYDKPSYWAYSSAINSKNAHYILFGYSDGFYENAPEPVPGVAYVVSNGSSIMVYSGDEDQNGLHKYLYRLFDDTPAVDGVKNVDFPEGVRRVVLKVIPHNSRACIGERFLCLF